MALTLGALALSMFLAPTPASAHTVVCSASANQPVIILDIPYKFVLGRGTFSCGPTPPDSTTTEVCLQYASTKTTWTNIQCSTGHTLAISWTATTSYPCPAGVTRTYRSRAKLDFFHGTLSHTGYKYSASKTISC